MIFHNKVPLVLGPTSIKQVLNLFVNTTSQQSFILDPFSCLSQHII